MAVAELTDLFKKAHVVDFCGAQPGGKAFPGFGPEFSALIRTEKPPKAIVIIDSGTFFDEKQKAAIVVDHLNLTGTSPLIGPNHPAGERFTVVQNIYVPADTVSGLKPTVTAGLKPGVKPTGEEIELMKKLGADSYCYNLIPAMLIAAHASCRVLGILVQPGAQLEQPIASQILQLVGA